jgi:hypothetical protein
MDPLPARGDAVRRLGLALPPARMPIARRGRPLKRWRWAGVFGPELMLCVGDARVAGMPQRWWAIALPDGRLSERTTAGRGGIELTPERVAVRARGTTIALDLDLAGGDEPVEVASPHGRSYIWTRKQVVPARGEVRVDGRHFDVDGRAFVDESAGYHARRTSWRWSAGVGGGPGGERLAWNLVDGVHDDYAVSERTVWVDGSATEVAPAEFAPDLSRVGEVSFREWCAREERTNRLLVRSDYRQPFGEFTGLLPGGVDMCTGWGIMETHDVYW